MGALAAGARPLEASASSEGVALPPIGLHRYACLTAACAFALLIAGGLVTSTGSGLAVPDWPLSYGRFFPRMAGGVFFEHGHRMIAGTVGLMTLSLAFWFWIAEPRRWVRRVAAAAAVGILLQALLGGITVLYSLPHAVSILHACLGQAVFCLILSLAQVSSPGYLDRSAETSPGFWKIGAAAAGAVYLQLVLGAVLRHTGRHVGWHLLGALIASAAIARLVYKVFRERPQDGFLARPAALLSALLPFQVFLGIASYFARSGSRSPAHFWQAALPTAHVACGALILGVCVVWTLRAAGTK